PGCSVIRGQERAFAISCKYLSASESISGDKAANWRTGEPNVSKIRRVSCRLYRRREDIAPFSCQTFYVRTQGIRPIKKGNPRVRGFVETGYATALSKGPSIGNCTS